MDLEDPTRTVSKSHARLILEQGVWSVEDLGSTNGTYVIDDAGAERQIPVGTRVPISGRVAFGDMEVTLRRREDG